MSQTAAIICAIYGAACVLLAYDRSRPSVGRTTGGAIPYLALASVFSVSSLLFLTEMNL